MKPLHWNYCCFNYVTIRNMKDLTSALVHVTCNMWCSASMLSSSMCCTMTKVIFSRTLSSSTTSFRREKRLITNHTDDTMQMLVQKPFVWSFDWDVFLLLLQSYELNKNILRNCSVIFSIKTFKFDYWEMLSFQSINVIIDTEVKKFRMALLTRPDDETSPFAISFIHERRIQVSEEKWISFRYN